MIGGQNGPKRQRRELSEIEWAPKGAKRQRRELSGIEWSVQWSAVTCWSKGPPIWLLIGLLQFPSIPLIALRWESGLKGLQNSKALCRAGTAAQFDPQSPQVHPPSAPPKRGSAAPKARLWAPPNRTHPITPPAPWRPPWMRVGGGLEVLPHSITEGKRLQRAPS